MEAVERNWAELPPELLDPIAKKLPDISDFIRSRAICKPWRSTISVSDLPPHFPWILNLGKKDHMEPTGPDLEFYSIASNKVYTIHAPNSSDKLLFGPACGYMLTRKYDHKDCYSLLNPLNNSEVCLPDLDGFPFCDFLLDISWIGPLNFQSDDYVVIVDPYRLVVCKAGDDKWDCIGDDWCVSYFYLKSLLFILDKNKDRVIRVMDIGSRKEAYVIPPPKDEKFSGSDPYLVDSCGEILRVCCSLSFNIVSSSYNMADYEFEIHRLEFGNGNGHPRWVKVSSIGDQIMFFDFASDRGFCIRANDFTGFKGNCIYFINTVNRAYSLGMYDIENGTTVSIDCPFDRENCITWFVPTLNHI